MNEALKGLAIVFAIVCAAAATPLYFAIYMPYSESKDACSRVGLEMTDWHSEMDFVECEYEIYNLKPMCTFDKWNNCDDWYYVIGEKR